ncbi:MAG TPA: peptidylprolyl isomerase [Polyangiaceae bacterium]|jgi:parvulin-like peptidyl-prolyl isomerase|nr:peptidylprolyl isomerase [Polyangiaceae bacterium]
MKKLVFIALVVTPQIMVEGCDDKYKQMEQQAAASASAAAAASAAALAALPSASTAPPPKVKTPAGEWITAQHILISYKGAKGAPLVVTRTKEQARARAAEALAKAKDPAMDFVDVVNIYSDDLGTKERLGSVGKIKRENVFKEFADAAWKLDVDEISPVVESPAGFHIIKRNQ